MLSKRALSVFAPTLATLLAGCFAAPDGNPTPDTQGPVAASADALQPTPHVDDSLDSRGVLRTIDVNGKVDHNNPFFQNLGTNGRTCGTCHVEQDAWTITPAHVQDRFEDTNGTDPLFRVVDGSNSPNADVSTLKKRKAAYSMLLNRAVIRIGLPVPATAEFTLSKVDDPYKFASAGQLSLFRRPLPTTNLRFLSTVMWDGRESTPAQGLDIELGHQAVDATNGHAQAAHPPTPADVTKIVAFEDGLFTAQIFDFDAGDLRKHGASGGPQGLATQPFYLGINDPFGLNPTGAAFDPNVFTMYSAWAEKAEPHHKHDSFCHHENESHDERYRESVARGEDLFNNLPIDIIGVAGINDALSVPVFHGHCTTCHDTPNVGDHSLAAALNIGIADASRRTPDMPLYTFKNKTTGATVQVTDPGRALVTGKWADIGKFKGPILRGLAGRAPYFHNGSAKDFQAVIDFYVDRFNLTLTSQEEKDFVAFLGTL